jgi:hypothetical protein
LRIRIIKFEAFSGNYYEIITQDKDDSIKNGESIGRSISKLFYKGIMQKKRKHSYKKVGA